MNQINQAQHGIASSSSGGVDPEDVTLQLAYDGGNTIDETAGRPVDIANAGAIVEALLRLLATGVGGEVIPALKITHDGSAPPADVGVIDLTFNDPTGSWVAIGIESADPNPSQRVLRVYPPGRNALWLEIAPDSLLFLVPRAERPYAFVQSSDGKALLLQTNRTQSGDGTTPGVLKIGPASGGDNVDGGITVEGVNPDDTGTCTGRVRVETHALGATVADNRRGALRLPNVGDGTNALECDPPAEGDVVLRTSDIDSNPVTKGFRGFRNGNWGLFSRGYQRSFDDSDLVGGVLTVDVNLGGDAPIVQLWETQSGVPTQVPAGIFTFTVRGEGTTVLVTFDSGMLPLTNLWRITVLAF